MNNFKDKLALWSNGVVDYCHEFATDEENEMDLTFYAFQSVPKENPELLILGINPAGNFTYGDLYNNPVWQLKDAKRMTPEIFIKPNPFYAERENWLIWKNLKKSFKADKMNKILSDSVYMNAIYFNTPNIESLLNRKRGQEVFQVNMKSTLDLIENIIKPKRILCLGTGGCFDKLVLKNKSLLVGGKKRLVTKGYILENIPVYGIPHPSGSITSDLDRQEIEKALTLEFGF